ncbi:MAG TPA: hypothetical protein VK735_15270 [Pseudonocardia sp.]|uniref:hypothetical protein n=1 Tax=Pseudonocardia sp. TaxID=60912 RepID=UPI002B9275A1|nr:hypothetical protein [Pseudonocardia sp.]HTF48804.1 hypothetical protein [Pseudonocardia sp.]
MIDTVKRYTCDAPGCTRSGIQASKHDAPPVGVHVKSVLHVYGGGETVHDVYACSPEHIGDAIRARLEQAREQ